MLHCLRAHDDPVFGGSGTLTAARGQAECSAEGEPRALKILGELGGGSGFSGRS